jgi:hypothetical protein
LLPPLSARYAVGFAVAANWAYHPVIVLLSVHGLAVPVVARLSKFCVEGEPSVVRLTCACAKGAARASTSSRKAGRTRRTVMKDLRLF